MRTTLITGSLAVLASSALTGLGASATASAPTAEPTTASTSAPTAEPTTTRERGIVIECSGTFNGRAVYASLYENNTVGNTIQIVIGEDENQVGGSRDTTRDFLDGRHVRGTLTVGGKRAVIEGTAHRVGKRTAVHEEHDDAGQHITVDGYHRQLATDLHLTWKRTTVPLDCDPAFVYNLRVTKESTVD
jgi:hypothetical protein